MFKSYASKITSFLIENKEINQDDYEVYKYGFDIVDQHTTEIYFLKHEMRVSDSLLLRPVSGDETPSY